MFKATWHVCDLRKYAANISGFQGLRILIEDHINGESSAVRRHACDTWDARTIKGRVVSSSWSSEISTPSLCSENRIIDWVISKMSPRTSCGSRKNPLFAVLLFSSAGGLKLLAILMKARLLPDDQDLLVMY